MDKTMFMEKVKTTLEEIGYTVFVNQVVKSGHTYTGLACCRETENISVCLNLDIFYAESLEEDFDTALANLLASLKEAELEKEQIPNARFFAQYEQVKQFLFLTVLDKNRNAEYLKAAITYPISDTNLVLVPRIYIKMTEGIGSCIVTKELVKVWGTSLDELYQEAVESTVKLMPPVVMPLIDKIRELTVEMPSDADLSELVTVSDSELVTVSDPELVTVSDSELMTVSDSELVTVSDSELMTVSDSELYLISNQDNLYGAAVAFYPGMLEKLGEIIGGNFYLLPSSIHECLIMPAMEVENQTAKLLSMVRDINKAEVAMEEQLSDNVFFYNVDEQRLTELS